MPNKKKVSEARKNKAMKPVGMDVAAIGENEEFNDSWKTPVSVSDYTDLPEPEPEDDEIIGDEEGFYRPEEEKLNSVQ